ncbi:uncharacterized protein BX664DRAFT_288548 [Halteromyces radiatus]|uniref:uncharacterized protein n=1 Tax=Halteromyces radiatus TaxID=101107 RepID=UPI00221EB4D1|nr:uncharacterized protein BX664DRAFT_288548 [Halteromyces radiatus]KAI8098825.1 hypothetical protein BX664DRAFT_288548 [Halteromyces radiatus]
MAIPSNASLLDKYLRLSQGNKVQVEYIWIDNNTLRSKSRTLDYFVNRVEEIPEWYDDGQEKHDEIILRPVALYHDPFRPTRDKTNKLVLCDTYLPDGTPHPTNYRYHCHRIMNTYDHHAPWFGMEQEYLLIDPQKEKPLGWPQHGFPEPQGKYYCGVGADKIFGRDIVEAHYRACLYAGIRIGGANVEVCPSQFEFQVGPCPGITMGDELWMARYLLERVGETFGVGVTFHPKPVQGDWNGAGCHTNYSTKAMRQQDDGLATMEDAIERMSLRHFEHIAVYGEDNDLRLTGHHETGHIGAFSYGIANRGASIRIPRHVAKQGKGYMEDRRPASNVDPYRVTSIIVESSLSPIPSSLFH